MPLVLRLIAAVLAVLGVVACEHKRSEAIVLEKEHIAAREATVTATPTATTDKSEESVTVDQALTLPSDEITADGYVMKAKVRGTALDPRALANEQWLIKVKTTNDGRVFNVHAQQPQFERVRAGDRVQVTYRVGKYTRTVWDADITKVPQP